MVKIRLNRHDMAIFCGVLILIALLIGTLLAQWELKGQLHSCLEERDQPRDIRRSRYPEQFTWAENLTFRNLSPAEKKLAAEPWGAGHGQ